MGKEKKETQTDQSQTVTSEQTSEERRLNQADLELREQLNPDLIETNRNTLSLINRLVTGGQLPGQLEGLFAGISPEITSEIANESIADIQPFLQSIGQLNSGVNASVSGRIAGDVRRGVAQFNLENKRSLLQTGLTGSAASTNQIGNLSAQLGQRLAGLRSTTGTGSSNVTTFGMNPFLKSFQTSLGSTLGAPQGTAGPFKFNS